MARPKKATVDYFPHNCTHQSTMFILEQNYGNDGYAFWFKLLEMLGSAEGHSLDLSDESKWEFLKAKVRLSDNLCGEILDKLAKLGAIDGELWAYKIVWCEKFVSNLEDVYRNRTAEKPSKPEFPARKPPSGGVSDVRNPYSKGKETKLNEIKVEEIKEPSKEGGKPDINECIEYLKHKIGATDGTERSNRYQCNNLLKKIEKEFPGADVVLAVKALIERGLADNFHSKNLTNFGYLFRNWVKIKNLKNNGQQTHKERLQDILDGR